MYKKKNPAVSDIQQEKFLLLRGRTSK